jgi:putative salt-induced outer membrane protein YdiY
MLKTTEAGTLQLDSGKTLKPVGFLIAHVASINPPEVPAVAFTGRINAGVDVKKGNTDTKAFYIDGELEARTEKNRYTAGGEVNHEKESGKKTADNWLLYMGYDHFLTQKWFFYANANFEQDAFKDINLRTTVGAGPGYQFFESEQLNLSVRGGIAYVNVDYSVDDQDNDYTAGRWALKYDQYFFDKVFQLFHLHEGIVSLEDTEDILVRTRTGVRIPLKKGFNTTAQFNWDWDNSPAPNKDRVDKRYLITLGYSWE